MFRKYPQLEPNHIEALEKLSEISLKIGNYEKSLTYINQLLSQLSSIVYLEESKVVINFRKT